MLSRQRGLETNFRTNIDNFGCSRPPFPLCSTPWIAAPPNPANPERIEHPPPLVHHPKTSRLHCSRRRIPCPFLSSAHRFFFLARARAAKWHPISP